MKNIPQSPQEPIINPLNQPTIKEESPLSSSKEESSEDNITEGKWLDTENIKFAIYMTINKDVFKSKEKRKA